IMTASAPVDMTQCAIDCSTYCRVLPVNNGRAGSACMKQAEMPIFRRAVVFIASARPAARRALRPPRGAANEESVGAPYLLHRFLEQAPEISRGARPGVGLVANVRHRDFDQARQLLALDAVRAQL